MDKKTEIIEMINRINDPKLLNFLYPIIKSASRESCCGQESERSLAEQDSIA